MNTSAEVDAARLLPGVVAAVQVAALPVMDRFQSSPVTWAKDEQGRRTKVEGAAQDIRNPVTEADLEADKVLREHLQRLLPEAAWLSEESADDPVRLSARYVWVVDPIDGTREYVAGIPEFAISVALVDGGIPLLAVLYNPATEDLFTAVRGQGAWRNGAACQITASSSFDEAILLASRSEIRRGEFARFAERMQVRAMGSTAWKLALLAGGEGQVYFTRKPRHEWDVAAGVLLCSEAGARVTDLGGDEHRFNRVDTRCRGVVAVQPQWYSKVFAWIQEVGTLE